VGSSIGVLVGRCVPEGSSGAESFWQFFVHFDRLGCNGGGGWSGSNFSSASNGTKQLTSRNKDDAEMISVVLHHPCLVFLLKMS
jgi:hypothetical protein